MKLFSKLGGLFKRAVSAIKNRFSRKKPKPMAPGAQSVKERMKRLEELGVRNSAIKKFESYERLFKIKHDKEIWSTELDEFETEEAMDIFNMFLSDPTTSETFIKMKYAQYEEVGMVSGAESIADMAKQIDVSENRILAKTIHDVLGSPIENQAWDKYESIEENNAYVQLMKDAIMNTVRNLQDDGMNLYTAQPNGQERLDMVLAEYKRLKEDYEP